jgi:hypothetical protein
MPDYPTITLQVAPRHAQAAVHLACKALKGEIDDGASAALRRADDRLVVVVVAADLVEVKQWSR